MIGLHTILAPVLSRLLSRYVDGISAETLRIGLLSRKLSLSNFTVNVDALDELALPCRVVRVRVDALDLKYAVFGRDPLRATIDGVEIELESLDDSDATDASVDFEDLLRRRDAREEIMEQISDAVVSSVRSTASESSWTLLAGVSERLAVEFRRASARFVVSNGSRNASTTRATMRASFERFTIKSVASTSGARDEEEEEEEEDVDETLSSRKRAKTDAVEVSFSGRTTKRIEMDGLSIIVDDGESAERDVIGPSARVRMEARLRRRAGRARYAYPNASKYVMNVEVKDVMAVSVSARQLKIINTVRDEIEMWSKRRAHGEIRPSSKAPIEWWRYAVRATVPRGRHRRERLLRQLRHARAQLESYLDVYIERALGKKITTPTYLRAFESSLTTDDVDLIKSLADHKAKRRQELADDEFWMFPTVNATYSAADVSETGVSDEGFRFDRTPGPASSTTSNSLTSYLYAKSTGYISRAYGYVKYANSSPREEDGDFAPAIEVRIPGTCFTARGESGNELKVAARGISIAHAPVVPDSDGVTSETIVEIDEVLADDVSGDGGKLLRSRMDDERSFVTIKMNPDACPTLDAPLSVHVKVNPCVVAVHPSTVKTCLPFIEALETPFITKWTQSVLGLNHRSPRCRMEIVKHLGRGMRTSPILLEVDSPLFLVPAHDASSRHSMESSAMLAFGVNRLVICQENGARSREDAYDCLVAESNAMLAKALDGSEAWKALEKMTNHILCSRNVVHVDGAWMTAANSPKPIVAGMNLSLVNLQTAFDSSSTMIDLDSVEFTLTPESLAALVHAGNTFTDAMPASGATAEKSPPSPMGVDDLGVRFKSGELKMSLQDGSDSLCYSIADAAVEFKKTIDEWRMKSTVGVVSGAHVSGAARTDVMSCSADAFLKAHVCSRIAGSINVASIDARITRGMLDFADGFLRRARGASSFSGCQPHSSAPSATSISERFARSWDRLQAFDIEDSPLVFLRGAVEPMSFKLFDERLDENAVAVTTRAVEIRGNASFVELELPQVLLSVVSEKSTTCVSWLEDVHVKHSVVAASATDVNVGALGFEVTPDVVRRTFAMMASLPDLTFPSSSAHAPSSAHNAEKTTPSVPNVQMALKTVRLIARDEDEACLALADVVATVSAAGDDACVAALNVGTMDFTMSRLGDSERCVRLLKISSEDVGALKFDVEYAIVPGARDRVKADARVGDACVELYAPSIICFSNILQRIAREVPPSPSPSSTTPSPSGVSDFPTISANFATGAFVARLPWRSEVETHAPLRRIFLRTRQSATLRDFAPGAGLDASFCLDELLLETGYVRDEDDADASSVMFTLAEVKGARADVVAPESTPNHIGRHAMPRVRVSVDDVRCSANEVSLHLMSEVAALTIAQPVTLDAIEAYEQLPPAPTPHVFEAEVSVDFMSFCLEHAQMRVAVPVAQAMITNLRADVKSCRESVEANVSTDFSVEYSHPVKSAWEPIVDPTRITASATMTPSFRPTSVSVSVESGVELTISHNVYEAMLKAQVVLDAARAPIVDLEQSTTFGPCTYQVTNATGFDAEYELSLAVADGAVSAGRDRVPSGATKTLFFAKARDARARASHRVIEHGDSYWASPIDDDGVYDNDDDRVRGAAKESERARRVSVRFPKMDANTEDSITFVDSDRDQGRTTRTELDARLDDGAHARVVAEVGPCADRVNRYELLLRSDVCVLNGTERPIIMCFQRSVATTATVFGPIPPSESVWLPIQLCRARKVQWRACLPNEDLGGASTVDGDRSTDDAFGHESPLLSPLRKSHSLRSPSRGRETRAHNWSTHVDFRELLARDEDVAMDASLCSTDAEDGVGAARPYACAFAVHRDEDLMRTQLIACAPLKFINTLPVRVEVACASRDAFGRDGRTESIIIPPGSSTLFSEIHPTWSASVVARVAGYTPCDEVVVPEYAPSLLKARRRRNGEIFHVDRDVTPVDRDVETPASQKVALRFSFDLDESTRVRTVRCAAPLVVLNSTACAVVLEDMLYGAETEECAEEKMEEDDYDAREDEKMTPRATAANELSPLPQRLFVEDAFGTPSSASPFARLAHSQESRRPPPRGATSASSVHTPTSPLLQRQSSLRLNAETITFLTPATPGQVVTPEMGAADASTTPRDERESTRATLLGSSAHWSRFATRRPRVRLRLKSSRAWSKPFRVDASGVVVDVGVPSSASSGLYEYMFTAAASTSSTERACDTAQLRVRHKYVVENTLDEALWIRHGGTERVDFLPPGARIPLRWFHKNAKTPKTIMFRPERGAFEWSKPVRVPDHAASMLKMRRIGDERHGHAETMVVSTLEREDGSTDVRVARLSEIDGALGMHAIENRSNASIWYHQLGAEDAHATLAPEESDERLIEDASLPRALVVGRGASALGEPISLDVARESSITVVAANRECLRITVARDGPVCRVVVEDATSARVVGTPQGRAPKLRGARDPEKTHPPLDVSVKLGWIGASVVHGHEELLYGRVRGLVVKALADDVECKGAVRCDEIRFDHTSAAAKRPIVVAVPDKTCERGRRALEVHVRGLTRTLNGLPVIRSLKIDLAPAFVDLHDELIQSVPLAVDACARHAELLLPSSTTTHGASTSAARAWRDADDESSTTAAYLQELIVNDVELVVSFSRLPGLHVAVRSLAGVDRARLRLRGFHMNQPSLTAMDVGTMAARHFGKEAVVVASSLWAHNSLLGDPRRLWNDILEALDEVHRGSVVTAIPRVIAALTHALARSGETALSQARDVVEGWLEALEETAARRRFELRTRRLGDVDEHARRASIGFVANAFETIARAVFDVIEGPLAGLEAGGARGAVGGSLVGVASAATRVLAAMLDVAEVSARRLRVFAVTKPPVGEYMRPRRPLPTSYAEPMRPYHLAEAAGREALARAARLSEDERFVAAASLAWPSHEMCVLTNRELFIVNRAERARPYARTIVRFADVRGVLRDGARVTVYATRAREAMGTPIAPTRSVFARAYGFASSVFGYDVPFHDASPSFSFAGEEKASEPTSVVARCADEDAARWLASALSPFVNANARAGERV